MKTTLLIVLTLAVTTAFSQSTQTFTLNGSINNISVPTQKVYISYRANGITVFDSTALVNGKYKFTGKLIEPVRAQLMVNLEFPPTGGWIAPQKNMALLFLNPASTIQTSSVDSFSNITIKGSASQDEFSKIDVLLKPYEAKSKELNKQYTEFSKANDEVGKKKILNEFKALSLESKDVYKNYIQKNPSSPIALYVINQYAGYDINADEVDPLFNALPASSKNFPSYKDLSDRLVVARKLGVGKPAIDFTQNDTLGRPVSLSSFKGKYVLVDFWASWCGPCRRENPNVVDAFNKYKDKGFTVLGVSLDQPGAEARWVKAIHDDKLTWTHVSDLKYWENDAAKLYGVRAIPFNVLLDKEGKIVAKNIRGEELQTKLAEIFQ